MKEITGKEKNIRMLLENARYSIDYYQREYKWQTKHLQELIEDLTKKFLESYEEGDERSAIQNYGNYFLGSIILCEKDGSKYIIDGQQRLTTITLILIYLKNILKNEKQRVKISSLIYSDVYGKESFNIDVGERNPCMNALFDNTDCNTANASESIHNIRNRYNEIAALFPEEFNEDIMIFFSDWLLQNVYFVEITASTDDDAYSIFETMNDRGLSLNPLDMLKGFLMASIKDSDKRNKAVDIWKSWSEKLRNLGKDENSEAFKTWFRSQYAQTIRERKKGATAKDFEKIGTEFHRWLRNNTTLIKLNKSEDFFNFINRDMQFYLREFIDIKKAAQSLTKGLESIFYNAKMAFTLQYPLLLAPLCEADNEEDIQRKLYIVSSYVDIIIARRIWNFKSITYSTMQYSVFNVMKEIRNKPVDELADILINKLINEPINFGSNDRLYLHQQNRHFIRHLLARITDFIETSSGLPSQFTDYIAEGKNRYEIEHIWADHPERHTDEFSSAADFAEYRNRIGGLLLLPKSFNSSYGDLPFAEKLPYYFGQNLLAKSLHKDCYKHNPGFMRFKENVSLPFKPHSEFKKKNMDDRQVLYRKIVELVWSPKRITREMSV
ncbi:hypothetical protein ES704_01101 [subsurface metagenome]|jgi:uncharacterized protein with ParB-like and HNH nuclease domain